MTSDTRFEDYQYVRRSVRRQQIVERLNGPMTATHLARATGMTPKTVSKVLAELRGRGLVHCMAPDATRCRPYTLTDQGQAVLAKLCEVMGYPHAQSSETPHDLESYAEVCHAHRAAVIRGLGEPRRACEIKKWLRQNIPGVKISANNIRGVISDLFSLGVVCRFEDHDSYFPVYALTDRGEIFRGLLDQAACAAMPSLKGSVDMPMISSLSTLGGEAI